MATFVPGGVDAFNAFAFSAPSSQDVAFFQNNTQTFFDSLGESSFGFFDKLRQQLQSVDFDKLKQFAQASARKIANFWEDDNIRPLNTLIDLQFPPDKLIRWQMANPSVRKLYHRKLCEGYGDKYTDYAHGVSGEDHHDWRMVMHGMEQYDSNGNIFWSTYDETFEDCDEESMDYLSISEKVDILNNWALTDKYLDIGKEDPTSQYSGML